MNFRRGMTREEPEINFIPLIDVLLVILIFLMVTTTYSKFSELQITLPTAEANKAVEREKEIIVSVTADGKYAIDRVLVNFVNVSTLAQELQRVAGDRVDPTIIVNADAGASHQAVVNILEAARLAQYPRLTFATQTGSSR
ncbi:ExbD/TolR family protein [Parvibium lacunae]|uniref:Biopolymer transporter ExbD n=1 Tax=Parvibium lacunae TaxID=1888893 RepID=A0A368L6W8_9BURK|nr:biopolymer transporter ExbD [Parvibium lacunae]RCS59367.1 biopolymer transporter ExbD [Parvibium lacunae]